MELKTKLENFTKKEVELLIKGILVAEFFGTKEFEQEKNFSFEILEGTKYFKIIWKISIGERYDIEPDPQISREPKEILFDDYFKILKTENLGTLAKYVQDMISEIENKEYTRGVNV